MNRDAAVIYGLLAERLAGLHYEDIPDDEFARRWDEYLLSIGARWMERRLPGLDEEMVLSDPLYTRGGVIWLDRALTNKILSEGLP